MSEQDIPFWAARTLTQLDEIQKELADMRLDGRLDRERILHAESDIAAVKADLAPIIAHVGAVRLLFRWGIGVGGLASAALAVAKVLEIL